MDDAKSWIARLAEAATQDSLVLLVGAGASMNPPRALPSWDSLVRRMAEHARTFQPARAELILAELAAGNYLGAAEYYSQDDRVPRKERETFFRRIFDTAKNEVPEVYRLLAQIPVRHRITTNFDNHLQNVVADDDVTVVSHRDLRAALSLWREKPFAVYLHGRAWDYDTLVYNRTTYAHLQGSAVYREFLKRAFLECSVVSFGYSFSDPDVNSILGYIGQELGGATERTHVMITSDVSRAPEDLLRRANFEVVRYDSSKGHAEAETLLRELIASAKKAVGAAKGVRQGPPPSKEVSSLVGLCASILSPDRLSTYSAACAAIVLGIVEHRRDGIAVGDLQRELSRVAHVSLASASEMAKAGVTELKLQGLIDVRDEIVASRRSASNATTGLESVVEAVEVRFKTYKFDHEPDEGMRRTIRRALTYVMVAQGMAVARAFANEDEPSSYVLPLLVQEALQDAGVPQAVRGELSQAMVEIVGSPTPEQSRAFFRLAHAAYALETVFLNPAGSSPGEVLSWRFYLDSNVALRAISPATKQYKSFGKLLKRLKELNASLFLLYPFMQEMLTHIGRLGQSLTKARARKLDDVVGFAQLIPDQERSPVLDWYLATCSKHGYCSFAQFRRDQSIDSEQALEAILKKRFGISVEGRDARTRFDTSTRETLWDALRKWRGQGQTSQPARMLRRNEATQIEWLAELRSHGVHSWFLSIDGQLRQALKFFDRAQYSGFVMTPTAWAHKLAEVHWGEVDMAGFSEMMWVLPPRTVRERLQELTIRQVLERSEDPESINLEHLRDRVDDWFSKGPIETAMHGAEVVDGSEALEDGADEASAYDDLVTQLVPRAVAALLDELAMRKIRKGKKR